MRATIKSFLARRSLRTQVIGITAAALAGLFAITSVIYALSLRGMLARRESDNITSQARLSESALLSSVAGIPGVTRDWSSWDETDAFVRGQNPGFLDDYLTEYPFRLFRLDLCVVLDTGGQALYQRFYNHDSQSFEDDAPDLSQLYLRLAPAVLATYTAGMELTLSDASEIGLQGFVSHGGRMYYLSCFPVINSDETSPASGVLAFGRIVDSDELARITQSSGLAFNFTQASALAMSAKEQKEMQQSRVLVRTGSQRVTCSVAMDDLFGDDTLALTVASPRTLYSQGGRLATLQMLLAACGALVILAMVVLLLSRIVVRPLAGISAAVDGVDLDNADAVLPAAHQSRELDRLATAVNAMLLRIKQASLREAEGREQLYRLASTDRLTGLPNRSTGVEAVQRMVDIAGGGEGVAVWFVDLGRFKHVNDAMGRDAGDEVIAEIARRLVEEAPEGAMVCRFEGDKFVAAWAGGGQQTDAGAREATAKKMLAQIAAPVCVRRREVTVEAVVGSAVFPADGDTAAALMKHAEMAAEEAKRRDGATYCAYTAALSCRAERALQLEEWLNDAVQDNFRGMRPWFQPVIDLRTGRVTGCEALIRWQGPEGPEGPSEFIPMAEESGLIVPITWWMLECCCREAARFIDTGLECSVAVNMPAQVLLHPQLLPRISAAAKAAGVKPSVLDIEIIERVLVQDSEKMNRVLAGLHRLGISVSVDDFGTGYSSLSYLSRMRVDRIKIDKSFVDHVETSAEDRAIVEAVRAVGQRLGMLVTAEGVEEPGQLACLKQVGVDEIQGYLFSRPLPADEFIAFSIQWQNEWEQNRRNPAPQKQNVMPGLRPEAPTGPRPPRGERQAGGEAQAGAAAETGAAGAHTGGPGEAAVPRKEPALPRQAAPPASTQAFAAPDAAVEQHSGDTPDGETEPDGG